MENYLAKIKNSIFAQLVTLIIATVGITGSIFHFFYENKIELNESEKSIKVAGLDLKIEHLEQTIERLKARQNFETGQDPKKLQEEITRLETQIGHWKNKHTEVSLELKQIKSFSEKEKDLAKREWEMIEKAKKLIDMGQALDDRFDRLLEKARRNELEIDTAKK